MSLSSEEKLDMVNSNIKNMESEEYRLELWMRVNQAVEEPDDDLKAEIEKGTKRHNDVLRGIAVLEVERDEIQGRIARRAKREEENHRKKEAAKREVEEAKEDDPADTDEEDEDEEDEQEAEDAGPVDLAKTRQARRAAVRKKAVRRH